MGIIALIVVAILVEWRMKSRRYRPLSSHQPGGGQREWPERSMKKIGQSVINRANWKNIEAARRSGGGWVRNTFRRRAYTPAMQ